MLTDSISIKKQILGIIEIIKGPEYIGKTIDAIFNLSPEYQDSLVSFIMDEIGQDSWEELAEDSMYHPEFFKAVLMYYSGRESIGKEPSRINFIELLEEFLESKKCHSVSDIESRKEFSELVKGLG